MKGFLSICRGERVGVHEASIHVSRRALSSSSSILLLIYIVSSSSPAGRTDCKWAFRCGRREMDENLHSLFSCFSFLYKNISGVLR